MLVFKFRIKYSVVMKCNTSRHQYKGYTLPLLLKTWCMKSYIWHDWFCMWLLNEICNRFTQICSSILVLTFKSLVILALFKDYFDKLVILNTSKGRSHRMLGHMTLLASSGCSCLEGLDLKIHSTNSTIHSIEWIL